MFRKSNEADHAKLKEFSDAMKAVYGQFKDRLTPEEMLACAAHLTGVLIALQDQRKVTPGMAMELVAQNIEAGNKEAIDGVMDTKGNA